MSYIREISGLRTVCVLLVILFHLKVPLFSKGFVGVDVFFVISGYLITQSLSVAYKKNESIKLKKFYLKRILRLTPTLVFCIISSFLIALLLFPPNLLKQVAKSSIYALLYSANIFFWKSTGYFDTAAYNKPLLHTWSLGVEGQFYLLWPLVLRVIFFQKKYNSIMVFLITFFIISVSLTFFVSLLLPMLSSGLKLESSIMSSSGVFYLLPFRFYQFSLGGVAFLLREKAYHKRPYFVSGLLFLFCACFAETRKEISSFLACTGGLLLLLSSGCSWSRNILGNRFMDYWGKSSYSIYLVHWPIIVFYEFFVFRFLYINEKVILFIATFVLGVIINKYVEEPFLYSGVTKNKPKKTLRTLFLLNCIVVLLCVITIKNGGFPGRIRTLPSNNIQNLCKNIHTQTLNETSKIIKPFGEHIQISKISPSKKRRNVLIIGDSHAMHLTALAKYYANKYNLDFQIYWLSGCPPIFNSYRKYDIKNKYTVDKRKKEILCFQQTKVWENFIAYNKFDFVILAARWDWLVSHKPLGGKKWVTQTYIVDKDLPEFSEESSKKVFMKNLIYTIEKVRQTGATPIIIGQIPLLMRSAAGCNNVPHYIIPKAHIEKRCNSTLTKDVEERSKYTNTTIETLSAKYNVNILLPFNIFCKKSVWGTCVALNGGYLLRDDDNHLNQNGALFLAKQWENKSSFPFA